MQKRIARGPKTEK